jgi:O-antigen/teichoic acid export membrane protein
MKREIAKGAAWMVLARWALRLIGVISTLVLARLLVPEDFGLVAMAMTVVTMIELMTWLGLEAMLIKHQSPTKAHYDTAWSLRACILLLCGAVTAIAAYPTAAFFREPRLAAIMFVLAGVWALQSLENIGTVDFRRNMQFDREFLFLTGKKLIGFVVCVASALIWRSYWALVAGIVASRIGGLALSYLMHSMRPSWSLSHWREMLAFSRATLLNAILEFASNRTPHIFIGRAVGPAALGTYAIAEEIGQLPSTEIVDPIGRTLFPAYSRLVADRETLKSYVLFVNAAVVAVALPACVGIALVAAPLVLLALGEKWAQAIPLMQVLAMSAGCMAMRSNSWSLYFALGKPHYTTRLWIVKLTALLIVVWPLFERFGIMGVAYADLFSALLLLLVDIGMLLRALQIAPWTYLRVIVRPIAAAFTMAIVVWIGEAAVFGPITASPVTGDLVMRLAVAIPLGVFTYAAAMLALWLLAGRPNGMEQQFLSRLFAWSRARLRPRL